MGKRRCNATAQTILPLRLTDIEPSDVLAAIAGVWHSNNATASIILQRLNRVFSWAQALGYVQRNPANGELKAALPKARAVTVKQHRDALPHADVADALGQLDAAPGGQPVKLALRFLALTACRTIEARRMQWAELDLVDKVWTIPAANTKQGRPVRVPLATQALAVIRAAQARQRGPYVFTISGKALGDATLRKAWAKVSAESTPHGFRSSFRDWAAETGVERDVSEASLGHSIATNQTEAAYLRTDLLERRRPVMQAWADYIDS